MYNVIMKLMKILIVRNNSSISYASSTPISSCSLEEEEYKEAIEASISTLPSLPQ